MTSLRFGGAAAAVVVDWCCLDIFVGGVGYWIYQIAVVTGVVVGCVIGRRFVGEY